MSLQPVVLQKAFVLPIAEAQDFDLNMICPLSLIRQHTKTDDVSHVTDEQLVLYRAVAFEAAEHYSGLVLLGTRRIEEVIKLPTNYRSTTPRIKHVLKYRPSEPIAYVYGPGLSEVISIDEGKKRVFIQNMFQSSDWNQCCRPCGHGAGQFKIMYTAGFSSCTKIPAGIIAGVLKFIAWMVQNPGDELMTVNNTNRTSNGGLVGTNNVAWASGALEMWREYNNDAY